MTVTEILVKLIKLLIGVIMLGILLIPSITVASRSAEIKYINLQNGKESTINLNNRNFDNGHLVIASEICPANSDFICIFGGLHFAIPRALNEEKDWEFNGRKFVNLGLKRITLFGKDMKVYRIEQRDQEGLTWFLFSKTLGIVSWGFIASDKQSWTYVVEGKCGFGASPEC